jgi:hypothetical protein
LPSVDCITPVTAGPKRSPTCSVANDTTHARPASATAASPNASRSGSPRSGRRRRGPSGRPRSRGSAARGASARASRQRTLCPEVRAVPCTRRGRGCRPRRCGWPDSSARRCRSRPIGTALPGPKDRAGIASFAPDGSHVLAVYANGRGYRWDVRGFLLGAPGLPGRRAAPHARRVADALPDRAYAPAC